MRFRGAELIDPDAIARRMVSGTLAQAAREAVRHRRAALVAGRTHLVETTLAGAGTLRHMEAARMDGYRVELHYVSLDSPDQTLLRIRTRVARGGPRRARTGRAPAVCPFSEEPSHRDRTVGRSASLRQH